MPEFPSILQAGAFGLVAYAFFYGVKAVDRIVGAAVETMQGMNGRIEALKEAQALTLAELKRRVPLPSESLGAMPAVRPPSGSRPR